MPLIGLKFLLFIFSHATLVPCICNDNQPIALAVQNIALSDSQFMRGIPVSIGTPPVNFSCLPQIYFNDTWVYNSSSSLCDPYTPNQCMTLRGGIYDPNTSSTSHSPISIDQTVADPSDVQRALLPHVWDYSIATDTLRLNDTSISDFPVGMPGFSLNSAYDTQCNIGLGRSSVLLETLLQAGRIASRSFSWWWGINSATGTSLNGQIVYGGYDAAKVQGSKYTAAITTPSTSCYTGLLVTIADIILDFPNGTTQSIVKPDIITACIQPDFPLIITMPWEPYFTNFENATNTGSDTRSLNSGIGFYGMLYPQDAVFDGNMIIELSDGLQITFPNDILVVPPASVSIDGSINTNNSLAELLINPTEGVNAFDTAILGRNFFQSAYLTVDWDSNLFTISEANPTTETNLISIGPKCNNRNTTSSLPSVSSSTSSTTIVAKSPKTTSGSRTSSIATGNSTLHQEPSIAIIAGAVVGGVVGILIVLLVAVFVFRRRHRNRATPIHDGSGNNCVPNQDRSATRGGVRAYHQETNHTQELKTQNSPQELAEQTQAFSELAANNKTPNLASRSARAIDWPRNLHISPHDYRAELE